MVFTVHLTEPTKEQLAASSLNPREFFAQRMRQSLKGIPYFFSIEYKPSVGFHIHGLLNPQGRSDDDVRNALMKVAGDKRKSALGRVRRFHEKFSVDYTAPDWTIGIGDKRPASARKAKSKPQGKGPYGWINYLAKDVKSTRRRLGLSTDPIVVARSVTQIAKQYHKEDVDFARAYSPDD